ncbi:uncharacterized protein LOC110429154 [Herrania umbratica]|uniref:Uncharacterized protein LOC110429154 n=1 Tax=Herrania umbratica TaxID=108875 RepID=A0A6J1BMF8_9ROSI|nr:uncharacterized protein LOC110429154 [Herrania umbratica]
MSRDFYARHYVRVSFVRDSIVVSVLNCFGSIHFILVANSSLQVFHYESLKVVSSYSLFVQRHGTRTRTLWTDYFYSSNQGISFYMSVNMEDFGANEQAMASGNNPAQKRGRQPKLTDAERHENKLESGRKYRRNKTAKNQALQEKNQELEKENKRLEEENEKLKEEKEMKESEINSLKEELLENIAQAENLGREVSDQSEKVNMVKMVNKALEPGMQQLQQNFLNQQDDFVNLELTNIPMDTEWLNNSENWKDFNENPERLFDETIDSLLNEGTSIAKTKLSPLRETISVEGFRVLRENSTWIQEIFNKYPNIASGLRVRLQASRDGFMNILAEVYKMATMEREKCNLEDIKHMEDGVEDLEFAGLDVSWLKDLVQQRVGKRLKRRKI